MKPVNIVYFQFSKKTYTQTTEYNKKSFIQKITWALGGAFKILSLISGKYYATLNKQKMLLY